MSSDTSLTLSSDAVSALDGIQSKKRLAGVISRIASLPIFPRAAIIDASLPADPGGAERRITYVGHYAIRYRFHEARNSITVDFITDERTTDSRRFV